MEFENDVLNRTFVKIGNLNWVINLVHEKNAKLFDEDAEAKYLKKSDGAMGMCYKTDCEIYVADEMSDGNLLRTLIHEITHATAYSFGMGANGDCYSEEELCSFMESHLYDIERAAMKAYKRFRAKEFRYA